MPPVTKLISGELSACCHPSHSIELNWFADAAQGAACGAVYLSRPGARALAGSGLETLPCGRSSEKHS